MNYAEMMKDATERHFKFYILSQGALNKIKALCSHNPKFKIAHDKLLPIINTDDRMYKCLMALLESINGEKGEMIIDECGPAIAKAYNDYIRTIDFAVREIQKVLITIKALEEMIGNENN